MAGKGKASMAPPQSAREGALGAHIEELEAQQARLPGEIQRLKRELAISREHREQQQRLRYFPQTAREGALEAHIEKLEAQLARLPGEIIKEPTTGGPSHPRPPAAFPDFLPKKKPRRLLIPVDHPMVWIDHPDDSPKKPAALEAAKRSPAAEKESAARKEEQLAKAKRRLAAHEAIEVAIKAARLEGTWRDWAGGLPDEVLAKVASTLVSQSEARWEAPLKEDNPPWWCSEEEVQEKMAKRKREGPNLFVFARVCKEWRKAQLKIGGPLRTRVQSDVLRPGNVALVKWALAEGCPRERYSWDTMAHCAALHGNLELVKWLCGEEGFAMDEAVMQCAAESGNLELVQWLRAEGCPWNWGMCRDAIRYDRVEVLRWVRRNGCPWTALVRDRAAANLGYKDNLGNLVDRYGVPVQEEQALSDL